MRLAIPTAALCAAACSLALVCTLQATPGATSAVPAGQALVRVTDPGVTPCRVPTAAAARDLVARGAGGVLAPPQVRVDAATGAAFLYSATRDGALRVSTRIGDLDVRKTVYADGHFDIGLGAGSDRVSASMGLYYVEVQRGGRRVRIDIGRDQEDDWLQVKELIAGSRALRLFRALTAALDPATRETVAGAAMDTADAALGFLDGDVGAIPRLAERYARQRQARLRRIAFEDGDAGEKTCFQKYEEEVVKAGEEYNQCRKTFNWYSGWQAACALRWTLQTESAWFAFLACSAIPLKVE